MTIVQHCSSQNFRSFSILHRLSIIIIVIFRSPSYSVVVGYFCAILMPFFGVVYSFFFALVAFQSKEHEKFDRSLLICNSTAYFSCLFCIGLYLCP